MNFAKFLRTSPMVASTFSMSTVKMKTLIFEIFATSNGLPMSEFNRPPSLKSLFPKDVLLGEINEDKSFSIFFC